uniref:Peptidase A1 domain-containing protein n=1 Tax=Mycena chlorophos TaxID=658473 RepID=A0ABQ0M4X4_MYCCL|nr:predicted protein [Mycena chlorophos]
MTQTPYDFPSPNTTRNNSAAPGALCRPRLQIMSLHAFGWDPNIRREELIKIDVERRAIVNPGPIDSPSPGIFYSPQSKRAAFYAPPTTHERLFVSTAVPTQSRRRVARSMRGIFERVEDPTLPTLPRLSPYAEPSQGRVQSDGARIRDQFSQRVLHSVPIRAALSMTNRNRSEIEADLAAMKKRKFDGMFLSLSDTKTLVEKETSRSGTEAQERREVSTTSGRERDSSKYDKTNYNVARYAGARSYSGDAILLSLSVEELEFADTYAAWLKLSQGVLRIMNFGATPSTGLEPFIEFDDFKFGTCDAATEDKALEQIDGMLGLSHKLIQLVQLFVTKYTQASGVGGLKPLEPILTIALGDDYAEIPGWLIIDPEGKGDIPRALLDLPTWSPWVKTRPKTKFAQWIINVRSISVGYTASAPRLTVLPPSTQDCYAFVLDTASLFTYFPVPIFNDILAMLPSGRTNPAGEAYCSIKDDSVLERLKKKILTLYSEDGTPIPLCGLDIFVLDDGPDPGTPTERYCSFRRGVMRPKKIVPTDPDELYILGNLFLRRFLVQFQHKSNKEKVGQPPGSNSRLFQPSAIPGPTGLQSVPTAPVDTVGNWPTQPLSARNIVAISRVRAQQALLFVVIQTLCSTFTLDSYGIVEFTAEMHTSIASRMRAALPRMIGLQSFILGEHVVGGLWPELLDALSSLPNPCNVEILSYWGDENEYTRPLILAPPTTELLFRTFSFAFPFIDGNGGDGIKRRTLTIWRTEVYNIRSIIQAATKTLETLALPGELLRSMEGSTWSSLTHLLLEGLWPSDDNNRADYLVAGDPAPAPPEPEDDSDTKFFFYFPSAVPAAPALAVQPEALTAVPTDETSEPNTSSIPIRVPLSPKAPPRASVAAPSDLLSENEDQVKPMLAPEAGTSAVSTSPDLTSPAQISSASSIARTGPLSPDPRPKTSVDSHSGPLSDHGDSAKPTLDVGVEASLGDSASAVLATGVPTSVAHISSAFSMPQASPELSSKTSVDMPSEKQGSVGDVASPDTSVVSTTAEASSVSSVPIPAPPSPELPSKASVDASLKLDSVKSEPSDKTPRPVPNDNAPRPTLALAAAPPNTSPKPITGPLPLPRTSLDLLSEYVSDSEDSAASTSDVEDADPEASTSVVSAAPGAIIEGSTELQTPPLPDVAASPPLNATVVASNPNASATPDTTADPSSSPALSALSRHPLLAILESTPNLQILDLKLVNHVDDEDSSGDLITGKGIICSASEPCVPASPPEFLRHLVQFQVTCLDPDDHVLEYLPAGLQYLSLPRLPYELELEMSQTGSSPELVLERLKQGYFPGLKTLRLWYKVVRPADLVDEKELIDFLPTRFPALQQLELCRRWNHSADSLKGRWDPLPVACALVSQLKELRMFKFDPDLPGIAAYLPFTYRTKRYHETIGRLHVMASAIVKEAPWLKHIEMYCEFGLDSNLYWEMWLVVQDDDGNVALDRPPPEVVDLPF